MPKTGAELLRRIETTDHHGSIAKLILKGELVNYIRQEGLELGYPDDICQWNEDRQIKFGWDATRDYMKRKREGRISPKQQDELRTAILERGEENDIKALCDEYAVEFLSEIPEVHYQTIMLKVRDRPVKPVTASH
jgi:hypothetical protein